MKVRLFCSVLWLSTQCEIEWQQAKTCDNETDVAEWLSSFLGGGGNNPWTYTHGQKNPLNFAECHNEIFTSLRKLNRRNLKRSCVRLRVQAEEKIFHERKNWRFEIEWQQARTCKTDIAEQRSQWVDVTAVLGFCVDGQKNSETSKKFDLDGLVDWRSHFGLTNLD